MAIINKATAKACFAGRTPIGETIDFGKSEVYQVVFAVAACLAAWLPALRAAKVDPMEALRYE